MQIQVFRTMASTTSAAQIPVPQQRYPFLVIRSLSDSITFACSSPHDSGSDLVPISLLMSFSLMPMTVTADQMGTVRCQRLTYFQKRLNVTVIEYGTLITRRGSVFTNYRGLHRVCRNSKLLRDEVLKPTAIQKCAQPHHTVRWEAWELHGCIRQYVHWNTT